MPPYLVRLADKRHWKKARWRSLCQRKDAFAFYLRTSVGVCVEGGLLMIGSKSSLGESFFLSALVMARGLEWGGGEGGGVVEGGGLVIHREWIG